MTLYKESLSKISQELAHKNEQVVHDIGKLKIEFMRKGCCHPQILDKTLRHRNNNGNSLVGAIQLDHVMIIKFEQSKTKCEEIQRDYLFFLFKMAGLTMLRYSLSDIQTLYHAAAIYSHALHTLQSNRSSSSFVALINLQGISDSLQNNQNVIPVIDSFILDWSKPFDRSISDGFNETYSATNKPWKLTQESSKTEYFAGELSYLLNNDSFAHKKVIFAKDVFREEISSKLLMSHPKTLLDLDIEQNYPTFTILEGLASSLNDNNEDCIVLWLFPAKVALKASDYHESYYDVLNKSLDLAPTSSKESTNCKSQAAIVDFPTKQYLRSKNWKIVIEELHQSVLALRMCKVTKQWSYKWVDMSSVHSFGDDGLNVMIRCSLRISLKETTFDTDILQELHVLYNYKTVLLQLLQLENERSIIGEQPNGQNGLEVFNVFMAKNPISQLGHVLDTKNNYFFGDESIARVGDLVDRLESRYQEITKNFVNNAMHRKLLCFMKFQEKVLKTNEKLSELDGLAVNTEGREWWNGLLQILASDGNFITALQDAINSGESAYQRFKSFRDIFGLQYLLGQEFDGLMTSRNKAVKGK